jgi:beta-glucosidase
VKARLRAWVATGAAALGSAAAVAALAPSIAAGEGRCGTHPWCNTALPPAARAQLLLQAMSLGDRVGILTGQAAPDVGLPAIRFTDGALGAGGLASASHPATAMPAGIALAANFSPAMAQRYGAAVGVEVRNRGFDGDYGPTVNIMRTPLGGRTYEGYGEDPFLTAQTAVGWIDGFQSQGVMADVKHYAANNQEGEGNLAGLTGLVGGRLIVNVKVDPRTLQEIEFPAFQAAVQQAHVATVMCSYNLVNGVYACANPYLLQTTLRDQWGFNGFVVSDAGACHEPNNDIAAGLAFDILGTCYTAPEVDLMLATGLIKQPALNARVTEILTTLFRFGFFDHPTWPDNPAQDNVSAGKAVADTAAEGGTVLLKNSAGVLPIDPRRVHSIAVIGPAAAQYIHGNGSSEVNPYFRTTTLQGIEARAAAAGIQVTSYTGESLAAAQAAARRADLAIVVAADTETEGGDRPCLSLIPRCSDGESIRPNPASTEAAFGDQDALISGVSMVNPRTVVVLQTGGPVLTPWRSQVAGLLEAWYPGEDGGAAIAHVLFGDVDPGGRLPVTFPQSAAEIPTAAGGAAQYPGVINPLAGKCSIDVLSIPCPFFTETYSEGVMVGYRWYQHNGVTPAFPFGYGLSYTSFRFSRLQIHGERVTVTVTNTGRRRGWAVPELYVALRSLPGIPEPPEQLKGFVKLTLAPGRSSRVTFALSARSFSYWSDSAGWQIASGCDTVSVGTSSASLPLHAVIPQGGARCSQ